jgi:hypothetical protein
MARTARTSTRPGWRDRHGRGIRAAVTGPHLPMLRTRTDVFDMTVASTAGYLKDLWPDDLDGVRFEVAALPPDPAETGMVDRMARLHRRDELHRRMLIESCVFRAVAELLGKDPWDLAPERFRHN